MRSSISTAPTMSRSISSAVKMLKSLRSSTPIARLPPATRSSHPDNPSKPMHRAFDRGAWENAAVSHWLAEALMHRTVGGSRIGSDASRQDVNASCKIPLRECGSLPAFLRVDEAGDLTIIITQMLIFCGVANVTDPSARA